MREEFLEAAGEEHSEDAMKSFRAVSLLDRAKPRGKIVWEIVQKLFLRAGVV